MKNYFEKIINEELFREEGGRKFWVHYRWQALENKLDIYSHRESGFKNSTILAIAFEVDDWRNRRFQEVEVWRKSKIEEIKDFKKSKFEEVKDWRSRRFKKSKIEEVEELKIWSLETQPESATQVESRGLLTWVCPLGTQGLVYRVRPIKEVDKYKDSKMTWRWRKAALICIRLGHL
jgi:hypothetical protein